MNLCGEFNHTLDSKNRLFIPAKYREMLGDRVMIIRDRKNKCLLVYSMEEWEKYEKKLAMIPSTKSRDVYRYIYSSSLETEYDSQGRVMLTDLLCKHAELEGSAVIVGCGPFAEIWNEENLKEKKEKEDPDAIEDTLEEYGV